jgi:hypothetical protein
MKSKVECVPNFSKNAKKIALHSKFDDLNPPDVPHNGCKGATKDTKPK